MFAGRSAALAAGIVVGLAAGGARAELLANGEFDTDVAPWADPFPDAETVITWSDLDAAESPTSGSMQVRTRVGFGAADGPQSECLPAGPGSWSLSGRIFVLPSNGEAATGFLNLNFYASPTCEGTADAHPAHTTTTDAWESVSVQAEAPEGTTAIRVRAVVGNTSDGVADIARFDHVVLTAPEPGAAAGVAAAGISLAGIGRRRARAA